jgi:hypothetical protein
MTLAGKILVFANLMLSVGMAAWAMGLYTQRVNWTNKSTPEAGQAELKKREDIIKEVSAEVAIAEKRHTEARARLFEQRAQRSYNNDLYRRYIDHMTGTYLNGPLEGATEQNPAQVPTVLATGQTVPSDPRRAESPPSMEAAKDRAGAPLRSYFAYVTDLYKTQDAIAVASVNLAQANKAAEERTKIIAGTEEKDGNKTVLKPGLRQLLENEQIKTGKIEAEEERLKPLLVNSYVEIQLLVKRFEQLKRQVGNGDKGGKD